jgi:serine protease AprX
MIVRTAGSDPAVAERAVEAADGTVVRVLRGVNMLVADIACPAVLDGAPGIVAAVPDSRIEPQSLGSESLLLDGSLVNVAEAIRAPELWRRGITGKGIGIALIDTGVAPVPTLGGQKVTFGPDLSIESQVEQLRHLDSFGHGTHMAAIMAGREGPVASGAVYAEDKENFYGIAPDASLLSIKVANHAGATDVSQVIAAIDWVVQMSPKTGLNIRIINLSYGSPPGQSPLLDPLAFAADMAMQRGIVVVTAAGNEGKDPDRGLLNPAFHPNVIAVGAVNTNRTPDDTSDDFVAPFSAQANGEWDDRGDVPGPDVVAPGVSIVSARVPGSVIALANPLAAVGQWGLLGSGTSQAAAVVSGAAALLLQRYPGLTPPQMKQLLYDTATPLNRTIKVNGERVNTDEAMGGGEINLVEAADKGYPTYPPQVTSLGTGSLENARGGIHLESDGLRLEGEVDLMGNTWDSEWMASFTEGVATWSDDGSSWNGSVWAGAGWLTAADEGWESREWRGGDWSSREWRSREWRSNTWTGLAWRQASWASKFWTEDGWSGGGWGSEVVLTGMASDIWATAKWG